MKITLYDHLPGHNLRPNDTAILINKLNGCPLSIMSNAVPHQHIELVLIILDSQDHRHSLPNLHYTGHLARPWPLANLDLHPALQVVAKEIGSNRVQHIHLEWSEGHRLFVEVVPSATQLPRLIPHFLHVGVVLNDNGVLYVATGRRRRPISCHVVISGRAHPAGVQEDFEGSAEVTCSWFQVDAMGIRVEALAEYHSVERPVELDVHSHVRLLALHLQVFNLRRVRGRQWPILLGAVSCWWAILCRWPVNRPVFQG